VFLKGHIVFKNSNTIWHTQISLFKTVSLLHCSFYLYSFCVLCGQGRICLSGAQLSYRIDLNWPKSITHNSTPSTHNTYQNTQRQFIIVYNVVLLTSTLFLLHSMCFSVYQKPQNTMPGPRCNCPRI